MNPGNLRPDVVNIVRGIGDAYSETFIREQAKAFTYRTDFVDFWGDSGSRRILRRVANRLSRGAGDDLLLRKAFARSEPRFVLAHYGPIAARCVSACRALGLPLVAHFHGYDASIRSVLAANAPAYRSLFAYAKAIVAVSEPMRTRLISLGAAPERLFVIPVGVDVSRFHCIPTQAGPRTLLAVGRFIPKKGPLLTLCAFARARAGHPDVRLRFVGDGPLLAECRSEAALLMFWEVLKRPQTREPLEVRRRTRVFGHVLEFSCEYPSITVGDENVGH